MPLYDLIYNGKTLSPKWPKDFKRNPDNSIGGPFKERLTSDELPEQLNQESNQKEKWHKVYENGWLEYGTGQKVSIHYFQSSAGRAFNVKVINGKWSIPKRSKNS